VLLGGDGERGQTEQRDDGEDRKNGG